MPGILGNVVYEPQSHLCVSAWARCGTSAPGRLAGAGGDAKEEAGRVREKEGGARGRPGRGAGLRPPSRRRPRFEEQEARGREPRGTWTVAGAPGVVPRVSAAARRPPHLQTPSSPPGRGRARRAVGARGGAGGGGQCETGWCCCARACSGPRCTSGCGCAPRHPRAPPRLAPQVSSGPGRPRGAVAGAGVRGAGLNTASLGHADGPFHPRALKSGKLEGVLCARPRAVHLPLSFVVPAGAGNRES